MVIYMAVQFEVDSVSLQSNLCALEKWETEWDMEFNRSKCEGLHVFREKDPLRYLYCLHGQTLKHVPAIRYMADTT